MAYNRWIYSDELFHHGVKGQKWGERNGPPYPLDRSLSDGSKLLPKATGSPQTKKKYKTSEKTAHKRAERKARTVKEESPEKKAKLQSAKNEDKWELDFLEYVQNEDWADDESPKFDKKRMLKEYSEYLDDRDAYAQKGLPKELLTPDNKRAMANGRPLTEAVRNRTAEDLEAIAEAQKYDDQQHRRILNGANFLAKSKTLAFKVSRFNSATENGIPVKKNETSKEYDLKAINPGGKSTTLSGTNNCLLCTVAYDMRRRGYNVIARQRAPIELLYDIGYEDLTNMYKNTKTVKDESLKGITDKLKRQKNSRGSLSCSWKGKRSGHVVAYEVNNGKVTLYDAQDGTRYDRPEDLFEDAHNFTAVRLDNATPDYRLIKLAVE